MIVFFSIVVVLAIVAIVYYLIKILKEEKEYIEEDKKIQAEEDKKNIVQNAVVQTKKISHVFSDEEFEKMLLEAENDSIKMENLKRAIQDNLRTSIKMQDMNSSRKCNMQLKRIDLVEKKGN